MYKKSGELVKVQVWLVVSKGRIEFLTNKNSYKVRRLSRNSKAICYVGSKNGPVVAGTAQIITEKADLDLFPLRHRNTCRAGVFFMLRRIGSRSGYSNFKDSNATRFGSANAQLCPRSASLVPQCPFWLLHPRCQQIRAIGSVGCPICSLHLHTSQPRRCSRGLGVAQRESRLGARLAAGSGHVCLGRA